jgi:hypothetical protein
MNKFCLLVMEEISQKFLPNNLEFLYLCNSSNWSHYRNTWEYLTGSWPLTFNIAVLTPSCTKCFKNKYYIMHFVYDTGELHAAIWQNRQHLASYWQQIILIYRIILVSIWFIWVISLKNRDWTVGSPSAIHHLPMCIQVIFFSCWIVIFNPLIPCLPWLDQLQLS